MLGCSGNVLLSDVLLFGVSAPRMFEPSAILLSVVLMFCCSWRSIPHSAFRSTEWKHGPVSVISSLNY
jgi:hypothetical protein